MSKHLHAVAGVADAGDPYPTRDGGKPRLLRRLEPVAWQRWQRGAPLSSTQLGRWVSDGFLVLDDLFSAAEVAALQAEAARLQQDPAVLAHACAITEKSSGELRSLFRPQDASPLLARLQRHPRLLAIAQFLLDSEVYLHQARINFKPGFRGGEFWWHSDFETWHAEDGLPRMRALSVSVTLTDNTPYNGPLLLVPGSHRWFVSCPAPTPEDHARWSLREQVVGTPDEASLAALARDGISAATGPAGTVVLFDCNTLHGSPGNITPWPRSNVFFVYNSVHNTPQAPYCGRPPRPAWLAERQDFRPLAPGQD